MSLFVIEFDRDVNAPAEVLWQTLTDFASYPEWNPFILRCDSTLKPGDEIDLRVKIGEHIIEHQVEFMKGYTEGVGFSYAQKPVRPGLLNSFRSHEITPVDANSSKYRSYWHVKGLLAGKVKKQAGENLIAGFQGMTDGLVTEAEKRFAARA